MNVLDKNIVLYGVSQHLNQIRTFFERIGISRFRIINAQPNYSRDFLEQANGLDLISEETLSAEDIIINSFVGEEEKDFFMNGLFFCNEKDLLCLHPASLLKHHFNPVTSFSVNGFPGAGNVLFSKFLSSFIPDLQFSQPDSFIQYLALNLFTIQKYIFEKYTDMFDKQEVPIASIHRDTGTFILKLSIKPDIYVGNIPNYSKYWERIQSTHDYPLIKNETVNFDPKRFIVIRHPLDNLISLINKIGHRCSINIKSLFLRYDPNELLPFLKVLIKSYMQFMLLVLENKQHFHVAKYEDMTLSPIETFSKVSKVCGLEVSRNALKEWWSEHKFRNLTSNPYHFKGGGQKWTSYFDQSWYEPLKDIGLIDISKQLGYPLYLNNFPLDIEDTDLKLNTHMQGDELESKKIEELELLQSSLITTIGVLWQPERIANEINTARGNTLYIMDSNSRLPEEFYTKFKLLADASVSASVIQG